MDFSTILMYLLYLNICLDIEIGMYLIYNLNMWDLKVENCQFKEV